MNVASGKHRANLSRAASVTGIALVALFALAGCASGATSAQPTETAAATSTPAPTSTPVSTATPAPAVAAVVIPESEDAAVEQATATLLSYYDTVNLILAEGGVNPERIDAYATGVVADQTKLDARQVAELGYQFDGGITVGIESAYATEQLVGDETLDFGFAHVIFCNDSRDRSVVQADGSVPPLPADRAPRFDAGLTFDVAKMSWFLSSLTYLGTSCA